MKDKSKYFNMLDKRGTWQYIFILSTLILFDAVILYVRP